MNHPVIIGIAGGTGSGKTTVARAIYDRVGKDRIEWISHDSYYRNFDGYSPEQRHTINFDHPDSLETELLGAASRRSRQGFVGRGAGLRLHDALARRGTRRSASSRESVFIVEGIFVLAEPELRKRIDIKLFVDTPADIRFVRRLMRDIEVTRHGRSNRSSSSTSRPSARCMRNSSSLRNAMPI